MYIMIVINLSARTLFLRIWLFNNANKHENVPAKREDRHDTLTREQHPFPVSSPKSGRLKKKSVKSKKGRKKA